MKRLLLLLAGLILILAIGQSYNLLPKFNLNKYFKLPAGPKNSNILKDRLRVENEESVITKVIEKSLPSVVTVGIIKTTLVGGGIQIDPFDFFHPFRQLPGTQKKIDQNIGSGFIVSSDGLIITNKHVVSDSEATYKVLTNNNEKYDVQKIYRDPLNDLAILKIEAAGLKPLLLGDSSKLKLGQIAIAICTPLGEFTNTVTSGIISGLGRGITAGSPYEGYVEKLDNVIQTDAAISPGNSGGPLLNSSGEVIGVNAAIAAEGQNIGFAIPVNIVKDLIDNFQARGGSFDRPYIGVRYKMINKQTAVMNEVVEGAYIIEVVADSPAEKAGLQVEDIIIEFDGKKIAGSGDQGLAKMILDKKINETVKLKIWRNKQVKELSLILEAAK